MYFVHVKTECPSIEVFQEITWLELTLPHCWFFSIISGSFFWQKHIGWSLDPLDIDSKHHFYLFSPLLGFIFHADSLIPKLFRWNSLSVLLLQSRIVILRILYLPVCPSGPTEVCSCLTSGLHTLGCAPEIVSSPLYVSLHVLPLELIPADINQSSISINARISVSHHHISVVLPYWRSSVSPFPVSCAFSYLCG